jgi:hypothetical protein
LNKKQSFVDLILNFYPIENNVWQMTMTRVMEFQHQLADGSLRKKILFFSLLFFFFVFLHYLTPFICADKRLTNVESQKTDRLNGPVYIFALKNLCKFVCPSNVSKLLFVK